jgi:hypothetical protein
MKKGQQLIKVMSQRVTVTPCDANGWDTGSFGQYDSALNDIKHKKGLHPDVADNTICHELCHVIETMVGIQLTEEQIQAMGFGWYTIIRDNPSFIKRLQQNAKDES